MNLARLSLFSIVACAFGLVLLLAVTVISTQKVYDKQDAVFEMQKLRHRIEDFTSASTSLLLFGTDETLWEAFLAESQKIHDALQRTGVTHPDARKAAHRLQKITQSVQSGLEQSVSTSNSFNQGQFRSALNLTPRSRIILQQVTDHGILLNTALNEALRERQQIIARQVSQIIALLIGAALLFGALCVIAFGLIHRRVSLPAREITRTLEQIRAGKAEARAKVSGRDELSRLGEALNQTLDQRQAAERALEQALGELEATRDRLLRAQQVGKIGSWEYDFVSEKLEWSSQAFDALGVEPGAFGTSVEAFFEWVHPEDRDWLATRRREWIEQGGEPDFEAEYRLVLPGGEQRWVHARARLTTRADGTPVYSSGTLQDITDLRHQGARIQQLQQLIEGSEDLYAIVDESYRYVWVNHSYAQYHGKNQTEIVNQPVQEVLGAECFEPVVRTHLERCFAGEAQRFETEQELAGLGLRRLLVRYYPIKVPGESHKNLGAVITDMTDVRVAESQLAEKTRLIDIAGRAAQFGGWSVDLNGPKIEWSDITADIHAMPHGYEPGLEEGIEFYAPEHRERIRRLFNNCVERGEPFDEELIIIDAKGQRRWVRSVGEAVHDQDGKVVRVQGAFQDITKNKDLEFERKGLKERLSEIVESMTEGFLTVDKHWRYTYANPAAGRMIGRTEGDLLGLHLWTEFPELIGSDMGQALKRAMYQREPAFAEEFFEPLESWFDVHVYPQGDGIAIFFRDVSDSHRMVEKLKAHEIELRASRDKLKAALKTSQALIDSLPAHIALLDNEGNVIDVNSQWRHFGSENQNKDPAYGIGENYLRVCEKAEGDCGNEAQEVARGLREVLAGRSESFALEYPCHAPDKKRWFRVMFTKLGPEQDQHQGVVAMHVDVTERKLAEQEINRLAFEDPLTGLLSRNGFEQRLQARLRETGWQSNGVVVMVDVVQLHDVNDAHGYATGDDLLKELGRRLETCAGAEAIVGRAGGDEFVLYHLPGGGKDKLQWLEQFSRALGATFQLGEVEIEIENRLGFTYLGHQPRSVESLIREAELALFENRKQAGTQFSWVAYSETMDVKARERIQLISELRHAIDAQEFELHFQPKVNLADGRLIATEALIRWNHPQRGLQAPGLFIPLAEQSQLISSIGDWALREACRRLQEWREAGLAIVQVAVNVSLVQFTVGDFPGKVRAALKDFNVDPASLTLEITESVFERQSDQLLTDFQQLHEMGVRLSLDDFGTGYSSLLYLQRYPFDEIKIDRGFVDGMLHNAFSRNIVLTVMNLARALNAQVVAEGIESLEVAQALAALDCKIGQGYYYSVPLIAEDFRWLLEKGNTLPLKGPKKAP